MKCLPIVFGIDVKDNFPIFFGSFYKFVYYARKNKWPIIAQEEYFLSPKYYEKNFKIKLKDVFSINEIPAVNDKLLSEVEKYVISDADTQAVIDEFHDMDTAYINLMNVKSEKLYKILDPLVKDATKKHKDLKAILVWRHNKTISLLANKYNLKVINMELSTIRKPNYNYGLCYFQFGEKYSQKELNERYNKLCKELIKSKEKLPILTRSELLSILLTKNNFKFLKNEEEYDYGIALGLQKDYETLSTKAISNDEIMKSFSHLKNKNVLLRKHPANYNYHYKNEEKFTLDNSVNSIEFVSKCHKIISSVSNTNLEAMLLGKTCFTLGPMPFAKFSYSSLDIDDEYVVKIEDLNFMIFGFFVPFDLALDSDYITFRLNNPSEIDIYKKHYNYLINKSKKTNKDLLQSVKKRNEKRKEIEERAEKYLQLVEDHKKLTEKYLEEKNKYNDLINSRSWKMMEPIRKIKSFIKK